MSMYWWFLTVVTWTATIACGLCLVGVMIITALQGDTTRLWIGAAVCFVVWVIASNLRTRAEKEKRP
jgi:hypothetical protein